MLINGVKDPRITSMVSVTDVEVTNDLRYAYVYVSILGGDEESTLTGLKSAGGYCSCCPCRSGCSICSGCSCCPGWSY
nr:ribosome-binding factor A [Clostridioides difficile]